MKGDLQGSARYLPLRICNITPSSLPSRVILAFSLLAAPVLSIFGRRLPRHRHRLTCRTLLLRIQTASNLLGPVSKNVSSVARAPVLHEDSQVCLPESVIFTVVANCELTGLCLSDVLHSFFVWIAATLAPDRSSSPHSYLLSLYTADPEFWSPFLRCRQTKHRYSRTGLSQAPPS